MITKLLVDAQTHGILVLLKKCIAKSVEVKENIHWKEKRTTSNLR